MTSDPVVVAAVDIGGTKIAVGLGDAQGQIVDQSVQATDGFAGPAEACQWIVEEIRRLHGRHGRTGAVTAVGIGSPGPFRHGVLWKPANLPGWDGFDVGGSIARALGCTVNWQNDASATALGEWRFGAGQGSHSMAYVTVSTGIGAGLVLDGRPLWGASGNAGEIGHMVVEPGGQPCGCGGTGCLETVASGTAIARMGQSRASESAVLAKLPQVGTADVFAAWKAGDGVAQTIIEQAARALGRGLATIVQLLEPDVIVLGGGVMQQGLPWLEQVQAATKAATMPALRPGIRLKLAKHAENAGIQGALALALDAGQVRSSPASASHGG